MISRRPRIQSVPAIVQPLEPRCLFSAAVATLTGAPFVGTVGTTVTAELTIAITKESRSGHLVGTITEVSSGNVNVRSFTGSVNARNKLVLHVKKQVQGHFVIHPETLTGSVSADGNTLAGKTNSGGFRSTFSATRVGP